jgi:hypothetical protein
MLVANLDLLCLQIFSMPKANHKYFLLSIIL